MPSVIATATVSKGALCTVVALSNHHSNEAQGRGANPACSPPLSSRDSPEAYKRKKQVGSLLTSSPP